MYRLHRGGVPLSHFGPALYRNVSGIFVVLIWEDFAVDFPGGTFFPQKCEGKRPATNPRKKSGSSKIKTCEKSIAANDQP